jgi:hypothetical protein
MAKKSRKCLDPLTNGILIRAAIKIARRTRGFCRPRPTRNVLGQRPEDPCARAGEKRRMGVAASFNSRRHRKGFFNVKDFVTKERYGFEDLVSIIERLRSRALPVGP